MWKYSDFEKMIQIGRGGQGTVFLVRNIKTEQFKIMKILEDTELVNSKDDFVK